MISFLVASHADTLRASSPRGGGTRDEALRVFAWESSIFPIVPNFSHISENRQTLVVDSPNSDFGGKLPTSPKLQICVFI